MLIIYKILINALYICLLPYFWFKGFDAREEWQQRRVIRPQDYLKTISNEPATAKTIWLHASSMGEVRVLQRLVAALKKQDVNLRYCVSTYTRTGNKLAKELFDDAMAIFFFPLDCYWPLRRLFGQLEVDGVVIVETEIWPYFLTFCHDKGIPLVLANGRLSARSSKRYGRFRKVLGGLFKSYKKFLMQTEEDAMRMAAIGANTGLVKVVGNIKNDPDMDIDRGAMRMKARDYFGLVDSDRLVIFASTRPGEEAVICGALNRLVSRHSDTLWLIAPRHPERVEEVRKMCTNCGFEIQLYSDVGSPGSGGGKLVLMDRMGVLADLFYGADISYVGGTLVDLGGHNIMEPVLAGSPVLFGPSVYNVKEASEIVMAERFGRMVHDEAELAAALDEYLSGEMTFNAPDLSGPSVADKTAKIILMELFG